MVEGQLIYNFGIGHFGHFSSNFLSKSWSNCDKPNLNTTWNTPARDVTSAPYLPSVVPRRACTPATSSSSSAPWLLCVMLVSVLAGATRPALTRRPAALPFSIGHGSAARLHPTLSYLPCCGPVDDWTTALPPLQLTPHLFKALSSISRAHAHPPPSPAVRHWCRPVRTSLTSTPSPPQAPKLFIVHQKLPESLVDQVKPHDRRSPSSRGRRRTATNELAPPRSSAPGDLPSIFPRPHGSSQCSTLLSIAPFLTAV
jgi:hypothetical protein